MLCCQLVDLGEIATLTNPPNLYDMYLTYFDSMNVPTPLAEENLGISKILKKFIFFYHQKVHFPASKSTSERFLYPQSRPSVLSEVWRYF